MRQMASAALCALLFAAPVQAQDENELSEGLGLLEEGSRMLLRGLLNEMEPAMEEMSDELRRALGNLSAYEAPEILPNGDIIIRRKEPLEPDMDEDLPEVGEDGEVEL
ncbi:hypothetical protein P1J78_05400 [Psychromarinibacter sp. C21-152]|uniref:AAA+ family ATPase n=1 Tax=Psychromarinibacter sediminicola TaxID=3033385 RepID=A0AAE3T934_9RHOB|nr:hypothetical protein [Psychromarinibacter sediminicola]MDF0600160.1 hypothetical protein [Psychromarinibacter sediminicola]